MGKGCSSSHSISTFQSEIEWRDSLRKEVFQYARKNLIKANVYIKDPYVAKYVTEEKITEISFVGGVGGILGLFLGFSFISAVEVFYVFVCKLTALKASQCIERRSKRNRVTSHSNLMSVKGHQERY